MTPLYPLEVHDQLRPCKQCPTKTYEPDECLLKLCEPSPEAHLPLLLVCEKRAGLGMPLCPDALKSALDIRQVTLDGRHLPSRVLDGLRHAVVDSVVDLDYLRLRFHNLLGENQHLVKQGDEHVFLGLGFVGHMPTSFGIYFCCSSLHTTSISGCSCA
jgi:hypothetical protein